MNTNKSILLHICCAPDGSIPVPDLMAEGWQVIGFFYGSNIHPHEEYAKRLEAITLLAGHCGISCVIGRYVPEEWLCSVKGLESEPEGGLRCKKCFTLQLEACAVEAVRLGCESICTTLTISPHKNAALINSLGQEIADTYGLRWENRVWRKNNGFLRSVRASKELGLYRQNYCGCTFSKKLQNAMINTSQKSGGIFMQQLYATWRMSYIEAPKHDGCIFCDFPAQHKDDEHFIVHRGKTCFVIMNLYPYNPGHMMVIPFRHTNIYESLTDEEVLELHSLTSKAVSVLKKVMRPDGFNMGINLGQTAGAGVAGHLHRHIVPRWNGDNNFMPVLSETRVLSDAIANSWRKIKDAWDECI